MACTSFAMRRRIASPILTGRTPGILSMAKRYLAIRVRYNAHWGDLLESQWVHPESSSLRDSDSEPNHVYQSFSIIESVPLGPP